MGLFALCVDRIVARTQLLGRNTLQFFVQNSVHQLLATTTSMVPVIISVNSICARQTSVLVRETSYFFLPGEETSILNAMHDPPLLS